MPETNAERQIGYLVRVAEHSADMSEIKALLKEQGREAATARANMSSRLAEVEKKVELFEPIAKDFNRWRERGVGALMIVGLIASAITAAIGAFWTKIAAAVSRAFTGG